MDLLLALLLPVAVLCVGAALLFPRASRALAIAGVILAGIVVLWVLIHGVDART